MAQRKDLFDSAVIFITSVGLIWRQLAICNRLRSAQDSPRANIGTAAAGFCAFEGFAWPIARFETIYDQKKVVYYYFELQKYRKHSNSDRGSWYSLHRKEYNTNFLIVDQTGIVEVAPNRNELNFSSDGITSWSKLTESQRRFYNNEILPQDQAVTESIFSFFTHSNYRVIEHLIPCGHPTYVSGHFYPSQLGARRYLTSGLSEFKAQVFNHPHRKLKNLNQLLDLNRDGEITEQEFAMGYAKQGNLAIKISEMKTTEKAAENIHGIVLRGSDYPVTIFDTHKKYLENRLGIKFYAVLLLGIIGLAYVCLKYFGYFSKF